MSMRGQASASSAWKLDLGRSAGVERHSNQGLLLLLLLLLLGQPLLYHDRLRHEALGANGDALGDPVLLCFFFFFPSPFLPKKQMARSTTGTCPPPALMLHGTSWHAAIQ